MLRWPMLLCLVSACVPTLQGERGFVVGRAQLVSCQDEDGQDGALLFVESRNECWVSSPGERPGCLERRAFLADRPDLCSPDVVVDSPSQSTLTGFFGAPLDPDNYLAAGTTQVFNLPCNPQGPFADGYPNFEDVLERYTGDVRVLDDKGDSGKLEFDLRLEGSDVVALEGTTPMAICR